MIVNALVTLSYALIAAAAALFAVRFAAIDPVLAGLGAACLFLGATQLQALTLRRRERRLMTAELDGLRALTDQLVEDLRDTEARLEDVAHTFEAKHQERNERLVSEMRVLEALIKQLAENMRSNRVAGGTKKQIHAGENANVAELSEQQLLETIRSSLEENRVDLYLQPIVTLPQRRVRFYEGLSRLRAEDGGIIMPADYMRVAEPAGMMPTVDNLLLFRCVQVVRKLTERNRDTGVFCNISAHSLLDAEFFPHFIEFMEHNRDLAGHLFFEFGQSTVEGCGPLEEASLEALAELGFHFSLDKVTTLDLDLRGLYDMGFRFVKIPASLLLSQQNASNIHPADMKELLRREGLEMIVEKIEEERTVVNILDFNVDYGQGFLFGEPKPIRDDLQDAFAAPLPARAS